MPLRRARACFISTYACRHAAAGSKRKRRCKRKFHADTAARELDGLETRGRGGDDLPVVQRCAGRGPVVDAG